MSEKMQQKTLNVKIYSFVGLFWFNKEMEIAA